MEFSTALIGDHRVERHVPDIDRQPVDLLKVIGNTYALRSDARTVDEGCQRPIVKASAHAEPLAAMAKRHERHEDNVEITGVTGLIAARFLYSEAIGLHPHGRAPTLEVEPPVSDRR